jgi:phage regulator Rha-like protein
MGKVTTPTRAAVPAPKLHLVHKDHGQPVTTTLVIAEHTKVQHKNVLALVREHLADFEQFGRVAFETRLGSALPQGGFGASTEYAILNEHQTTLLFTYMRNSPTVRAIKVAFVKAFFEMAKELRRLKSLHGTSDWKAARAESACAFTNAMDMLKDMAVKAGEPINPKVYMSEAKMLRYAFTGDFST